MKARKRAVTPATGIRTIAVGDRVQLADVTYECTAVEHMKVTSKAEYDTAGYLAALKKRVLDKYLPGEPILAEFARGDVVTEKTLCVRLKSKLHTWNVYVEREVKKGDL